MSAKVIRCLCVVHWTPGEPVVQWMDAEILESPTVELDAEQVAMFAAIVEDTERKRRVA